MRREDIEDIFSRIHPHDMKQVVFLLRGGGMLSLDVVVRFEATFLAMRGREGGTTDEGRAFFVPYDEIGLVKLDRVVKLNEIMKMFGETGEPDFEDRLAAASNATAVAVAAAVPPPPVAPSDPATIAKQNLLDRIRAARTSASGATPPSGTPTAVNPPTPRLPRPGG